MLMEKAHAGGGHAELKTVSGDTLWVAWKTVDSGFVTARA